MGSDTSHQRARLPLLRPLLTPAQAVVLITATGIVFRCLRLGFQPLWWDEGYSVWFATQSLPRMAALTALDIHPPLYYALLHIWTRLFGASPIALRSLSVLIGSLTIPLAFQLGRRWRSPRFGLILAMLVAFSPIHTYYSQEVRMYGLVAGLSLVMTFLAARLILSDEATPEAGPRLWIPYGAVTLAALYTQYYAVMLPVAFTIYALWRWRRSPRRVGQWLGWHLLIALGYLPWAVYAAPRLIPYVSQKVVADADRPLGLAAYLARHLAAFAVGHLEGPLAPYWPLGLLPAALIVAWWAWWARRRGGAAGDPLRTFCASTLLVVLALGFALNLRYPFFPPRGERLLLLALPLFWGLASVTLDEAVEDARGVAALGAGLWAAMAAASLVAFFLVPRYVDDDYRPLIEQVRQQGKPDDVVWAVFPWQVGYFRSYMAGDDVPDVRLLPSQTWDEAVQGALDATLSEGRRIWLPEHLSLGAILESQMETYLLNRPDVYPTANVWYGPNTRLTLFTPATQASLATLAPDEPIDFGGVLRLHRASVSPNVPYDPDDPVLASDPDRLQPANDVVQVSLTWEVVGQAPEELQVGLRLADESDVTWAQRDSIPIGGSTPFSAMRPGTPVTDRHGLIVPVGMPPGTYTLWLKVYDPATGRALDLIGPDGRTRGTDIALGTVGIWPAERPLDPRALPIARRSSQRWGNGVSLLGFTLAEGPFEPGRRIPINLFWRADQDVAEEYLTFVQILDESDQLLAAWEGPPAAQYPTDRWQRGTLIRQVVRLRLPATVPDGEHRLIVGMFSVRDRERVPLLSRWLPGRRVGDYAVLAPVTVQGRQHMFQAPTPQHPLDVQVGSFARLIGYDLIPEDLRPGGRLRLVLYWRAMDLAPDEYTVFVHLVDEGGRFFGQADAPPGDGAFPTTGWLPGEYIADEHTLDIAADAPSGPLRIEVGMYLPATSARLPIRDARGELIGDHLVLEEVVEVSAGP